MDQNIGLLTFSSFNHTAAVFVPGNGDIRLNKRSKDSVLMGIYSCKRRQTIGKNESHTKK